MIVENVLCVVCESRGSHLYNWAIDVFRKSNIVEIESESSGKGYPCACTLTQCVDSARHETDTLMSAGWIMGNEWMNMYSLLQIYF